MSAWKYAPCAGQQPVQRPGSNRYTCGHLGLCDDFCWPSYGGDGRPALLARLPAMVDRPRMSWPFGIELVGSKLYIADSFNHRVRVVNLR